MEQILEFIRKVDQTLGQLVKAKVLKEYYFNASFEPNIPEDSLEQGSKILGVFRGCQEVADVFCSEEQESLDNVMNTIHDLTLENDVSLNCPFCQKLFQGTLLLEKHMKQKHLSKASKEDLEIVVKKVLNTCSICKKKFATEELLKNHKESLHLENDLTLGLSIPDEDLPFFCCQRCYKSFRTHQDILAHSCAVKESEANPVAFSKSALLQQHNRFYCGYCDEAFRRCSRMKYHVTTCQGGGPFTCELCQAETPTLNLMKAHKVESHKNQLAYWCKVCPKQFKFNSSLQKHIASIHEANKSAFRCDDCGKRFLKKVYLTNHRTRFHNMFKPFLCQNCGQGFLTQESLKAHSATHSVTKPFKCHICARGFSRKDKMQFHVATHTGEKPHKCHLCRMAFIRKSNLKDHIRRHSGERRFSCLVCRKMYKGSHDLRKHLTKHHPSIGKKIKANMPLTPQILANFRPLPKHKKSVKGLSKAETDDLIIRDEHGNVLEADIVSCFSGLDNLDLEAFDVTGPFFVGEAEQMH
ncbi:hypothetical protein TCAL_02055 [Tigriopus californicus]|uniref:C2H2-type domain-containing protein n=1 Tax=Tigriopus californicus TaxID=6832 RepID=A0A553NB76_TIGCA|nr:hypothetical protein TCAL_02055 [Tigriopus californicus]|eukprot:TCALIF_02055-PA protein Name:"Similar to ZNF16 Zinc finger protein 16 (Pan paniscus)" AED:0.01 eAED:0.01 QI:0/-1/0/1/-1/1/1/0/524